jgi:hypothetical protein
MIVRTCEMCGNSMPLHYGLGYHNNYFFCVVCFNKVELPYSSYPDFLLTEDNDGR